MTSYLKNFLRKASLRANKSTSSTPSSATQSIPLTMSTTVLITGFKSGIGKGLLEAYASRPNTTAIAAIRDGPDSPASKEPTLSLHRERQQDNRAEIRRRIPRRCQ
jgi:hypothetical protein